MLKINIETQGRCEMEIADEDDKRKKRFASFCVGFALPVVIIFTIIDFLEGDTIEIFINLLTGMVLVIGFYALGKYKPHLMLYRAVFTVLSLAFLYNVIIGAGNGTAIYWLYPFPPVFMFFLGKREGGLASAIFFVIAGILLINPLSFEIYTYSLGTSSRFLVSLLVVVLIAYGLESSRENSERLLYEKHQKLLEEKQNLQTAMSEMKTLSGLIPICANCKDIRNDEGYWQRVEDYMQNHTCAEFSHGLCPDCAKKLYPNSKFASREKSAT